tara:strand:- start:1280 stop:2131 length:852 start_codon:yes stop_codon:yes gene_type:complete
MALTITSSSYAGEHAGLYISAALKQADSLQYMTVRENVNYKEVVNKVAGSDLVKDRTCAFNENSATLTLTESVLEVEPFQVNIDVCKKTMLSDWSYNQMDDFTAYAVSYLADSIADSVENSIWQGTTATSGQFNKVASAGMTTSSASAAYSAANIIANLATLAADIPSSVYMKDDLYIYMNKKTYRFYINAISALSAFPFNNMGQYEPVFEGIKIAVCSGLADNQMFAGQKSNLFFGTSLSSDLTEIRVLDMADLDGSDNIRMVAKWTAGVQVGVASDFTFQS